MRSTAQAPGAAGWDESDLASLEISALPLLEVRDVAVDFESRGPDGRPRTKRAVDGVSFDLFRGKTIGIVGESGCGKTTLARTIIRLIRPTAGNIVLLGRDISDLRESSLRPMRRHMQIVFQDAWSSLDPRMSIGDSVAEPIEVHSLLPRKAIPTRVAELLTMVGLEPGMSRRLPADFSGGQRQRICIARAIAAEPKLIVLDEPTTGLDVSIQSQILNLLSDLQARFALGYVFISHNLPLIRHVSDEVAVMYLGRFVEKGPTSSLFGQTSHPYTKSLLDSSPNLLEVRRSTPTTTNDAVEPGQVSDVGGCRFQVRCPLVIDVCRTTQPPPFAVAPGHFSECWRVGDLQASAINRPSFEGTSSAGAPLAVKSWNDAR